MVEELVERVRNVKDELEIAALRKAIDISMESFKAILPMIKPGLKNVQLGQNLIIYSKLMAEMAQILIQL